jgi:NAD-dependent deacetylase
MPANLIPERAKRNGAAIIEVNTAPSLYTRRLTDIYLEGKAASVMHALIDELGL